MLIHFELPSELETVLNPVATRRNTGWFPIDVVASEQGTTVYAELPGVKKEDLQITFEEETLTISGKRAEKSIPDDARVLLHEQRLREFSRSILISHPVEQEAMKASLENGMLSIELPKAVAARPRTIAIR